MIVYSFAMISNMAACPNFNNDVTTKGSNSYKLVKNGALCELLPGDLWYKAEGYNVANEFNLLFT